MEDIIQILIFVGIAAFSVVRQLTAGKEGKKSVSSPKEVLSEPFPHLDNPVEEDWEQEEVKLSTPDEELHQRPSVIVPPVSETCPEAASLTERPSNRVSSSTSTPLAAVPATPRNVSSPSESSRIRLQNRQEARRAFLYAEIFQRKYE